MYAYVDWDVDEIDELDHLPNRVKIPRGMTDEDEISDYLSDTTGYCHKGFVLEKDELDDEEDEE
jgi:hypothetical protein